MCSFCLLGPSAVVSTGYSYLVMGLQLCPNSLNFLARELQRGRSQCYKKSNLRRGGEVEEEAGRKLGTGKVPWNSGECSRLGFPAAAGPWRHLRPRSAVQSAELAQESGSSGWKNKLQWCSCVCVSAAKGSGEAPCVCAWALRPSTQVFWGYRAGLPARCLLRGCRGPRGFFFPLAVF